MFTAISYIGAHWLLILAVLLGVIALGAFAWFAKNWKAAVAAVVLVVAALTYQHADLGGYKRRLDEEKAEQIKTLTSRIATLSLITSMDNQVSLANAQTLKKLESLSLDTPPNAGACLSRDAARRVRAVRTDEALPAAPAPSRHSGLFPRRRANP
ncbi:hypothetical protein HU230_0012500 [Bradyrhizobium quebecense]|uniref:Uncharacterized protein n=1 Tax=Bradyrhizobium quebecense TaxID=2748629 RepID=A0A973WRB7_9BRAD|nr:hypothetical protein [Bradyrhizobium quebecense]UGA46809.1 hypothetical protein HU230_0012500 [Bradyrhizobium quebecense]